MNKKKLIEKPERVVGVNTSAVRLGNGTLIVLHPVCSERTGLIKEREEQPLVMKDQRLTPMFVRCNGPPPIIFI